MTPKIIIATNSSDLQSTITLTQVPLNIKNDVVTIISSFSSNVSYQAQSVSLPWNDLKPLLSNLATKLRDNDIELELDQYSQKLISEFINEKKILNSGGGIRDYSIEAISSLLFSIGFKRDLKDPQKRDIEKLVNLKNGANFSVPGAGKTTSLLATHFFLKSLGEVNKLFVIAPINAFISWEDELKEIFGKVYPKSKRLTTSDLENFSKLKDIKADILFLNYEKLRSNYRSLTHYFAQNKIHFVLDESHRIKSGEKNLSFNQIRFLCDIATRRDIMSGTPLPQAITDLYPQFDFLWPGINFLPTPLIVNKQVNNIEKISESISSLYVRTTKNELDLDPPIIKFTNLSMRPLQQELYNLIRSEAARQLSGMDKNNIIKFRKINRCVVRLLQASTNPMLLTTNDYYDEEVFPIPSDSAIWDILDELNKYETPVKLEYLLSRVKQLLEENEQKKIVIWSYFVRNIKLLEHLLQKYNPVTIFGETISGNEHDINTREGKIRMFHNDPSCRILIGNPQACGEGISLHKASHYAIYFERTFNAAHYLQSIDRIHRLGLPKGTITSIEILLSKNTIDESINSRLNKKISLMASVLEDKHLLQLVYDPDDIKPEDQSGIDEEDTLLVLKHISTNERV